ncbi:aldo/keto reductase [Abortiporus biennis]|nr:aldo/keto reductase [Abortiporus biennis]
MVSIKNFTTLGGTASDIKVAKVAHGLMKLTGTPDEVAFEAIKAGVDALPPGVKMFLNSGEFYAPDLGPGNLELLSRFFEKYPEYAERTFLSVKGAGLPNSISQFDSSPKNLKRSIDTVTKALRGKKKIDLFQCARVDPNIPVEEAIKNLKVFIDEGVIDHIGISECGAATLRRANAVYPISVVEIEVSPWSYEDETKKVLATAEELGIAVAAYAPLGNGFLTGSIKSPEDIPEGDFRRHFNRFQPENFQHNFLIVEKLKNVAEKKGVTPAQLCIAWVGSLGEKVLPLPGSSRKERTLENLAGGDVELTSEEKADIDKIINEFEVKGSRYMGTDPKALLLWG